MDLLGASEPAERTQHRLYSAAVVSPGNRHSAPECRRRLIRRDHEYGPVGVKQRRVDRLPLGFDVVGPRPFQNNEIGAPSPFGDDLLGPTFYVEPFSEYTKAECSRPGIE